MMHVLEGLNVKLVKMPHGAYFVYTDKDIEHIKGIKEDKHLNSDIVWSDRQHFMWFPFSFNKYQLREHKLCTQSGLIKTVYNEVMLYRVLDINLTRTFGQKIFGTGTLTLCAKANMDGDVVLKNIKNPVKVKEMMSELVEKARESKRVVGKEFYSDDVHEGDI